ncbi:MAG: hypothetical protein ONB06_05190, partial [candidate division KSB1 bacterium]|nr:hypothetical protein [candidate division KSB1 bacterium]
SVVSGIVDALYKWMRSAGGLLTEEEAGRYLASVYPAEHIHPVAVGRLLFHICPRFKAVIKDHLWGLPVVPLGLVLDVQGEMVRILERVSLPLSPGQLVARFKETAIYRRNRRSLDDGFVAACLRTHPEIARDEDNRCVLRKWSKKRLDEIVQALHEIGRPAHFTVVAERANMLLPPEQRALAQTVRAYMERRTDLFVSLGRGIYWLRDHVAHAPDKDMNPPGGNLGLRFDTLARWQIEFDGAGNDVGHDTHKEVEKLRRLGLDFFSK